MKPKVIRTAIIVVLLVVSLILAVQAGPPAQGPPPPGPSDATLTKQLSQVTKNQTQAGGLPGGMSTLKLLTEAAQETENQAQAGTSPSGLSTPKLIEAALASGELDQDTASLYLAYALGDYKKLPSRYRSNVPWDGTLPLLHLQEAVKTMKASPTRTEIVVILSGTCSSSSGSLPSIYNSTHFHVEYGTIGGGLNINNYATSLETAWNTEITSFGWAAPPVLSSNPPPGNRYHVRIDSLSGGLYGYVSRSGVHAGFVGNNPNTTWNDVDAYASCMVLNRDYTGFPGSPQQALDATTAHEFNHSIQYGYGAITGANTPDDSFVEGGATWMEDEVQDSANDNYNYLWPTFSMCMGEYTDSPYPYWITLRGLTERYGTGTAGAGEQAMQDFWEETSKSSTSNMLSAINTALVNKGTTLADAYHAYAIAGKFNKTCGGGYVYPYCFEEAAGYVGTAGSTSVHGTIATVGSNYSGSIADNYALNWISLPTSGGPYTVTLQNTSSGGQLRGSVVCDTGSALNVNALPSVASPGSSSSLTNFDPTGCTSVVAVVTNQSQTANNPTSCTSRSYMLRTDSGDSTGSIIYLPIVLKSYPPQTITNLYIQNDTGDNMTVCISGIACKQGPPGLGYWGSFPPGTYSWSAQARCGTASGTKYFPPGDVVWRFWCGSGAASQEGGTLFWEFVTHEGPAPLDAAERWLDVSEQGMLLWKFAPRESLAPLDAAERWLDVSVEDDNVP